MAFDEVKKNHPACAAWLTAHGIESLPVTNAIAQEAMRIKGLLGIVAEKYGKGVGENDLLIIATAKFANAVLLTDEKRQPNVPTEMRHYRIPLVSNLPSVKVTCMSFVEMIKASGQTF